MFVEPEQRLPRAAKLLHFVEYELDRLLNAKVWVLLVAITAFTKPTGALTTSSPRRAFS
jgi:hypothetical protein